VTAPPPDVQHRRIQLVDYDEFDLSQLTTTTEANWSGLESVLSSSNWLTDADNRRVTITDHLNAG